MGFEKPNRCEDCKHQGLHGYCSVCIDNEWFEAKPKQEQKNPCHECQRWIARVKKLEGILQRVREEIGE